MDEKTYRVDSMLTQLRNAGKFDACAGVILGAWTNCVPEYPEKTLELSEIFAELIVPGGQARTDGAGLRPLYPHPLPPPGRARRAGRRRPDPRSDGMTPPSTPFDEVTV